MLILKGKIWDRLFVLRTSGGKCEVGVVSDFPLTITKTTTDIVIFKLVVSWATKLFM